MDHAAADLQAFKDEFARRRRNLLVAEAIVFVLLVLRVFVLKRLIDLPAIAWMLFMALLVLAAVWYAHKVWRCPNCGANPGYSLNPPKCEQCGIELSH